MQSMRLSASPKGDRLPKSGAESSVREMKVRGHQSI